MAVSLTRGAIRSAVLTELGEDTASPSFWSITEVDRYINIVLNDFLKTTGVFVTFATSALSDAGVFTITVGEGAGELAVSRFVKFYHGKHLLDVKTPPEMAQLKGKSWASLEATATNWDTYNAEIIVATGTTATATGVSHAFVVFPKPVGTWSQNNDNISFLYIPSVSLTADNGVPIWLPPDAHEALVHGTIVRCLKKIWNPESGEMSKIAMHQRLYEEYLEEYYETSYFSKIFVEQRKPSGLLMGGAQ